jgi:hypothetical protein
MTRESRREILEMTRSRKVRAEFRKLRTLSLEAQGKVSLETWASLNDFVRAMGRQRPRPRPRDAGFKL